MLTVPIPKTTDVTDMLDYENLDLLQLRISRGIFTNFIPPDAIMRMRCDIGLIPLTLTGNREVLSNRPATLCELHHVQYWSMDGATSTENGLTLCAHHHQGAYCMVR